jgi:hypothetical protein
MRTLEETTRSKYDNERHNPPQSHSLFAELIRKLTAAHHSCTIITFNYDVGLDSALGVNLVAYGYCLDSQAGEKSWAQVPYLKLHGSLNWFLRLDHSGICAPDLLDTLSIRGYTEGRVFIRSNVLKDREHFAVEEAPVIVPPTWNKTSYYGRLKPVWRRAAQELSKAENVFVCGYSPIATDAYFRYLFALGAAGKTRIRTFTVFDPDPSGDLKKRFDDLLGQGANVEWEGSYFTGMIDYDSLPRPLRRTRRDGLWPARGPRNRSLHDPSTTPRPPVSATMKSVSPEVSRTPDVPPVSPPLDRIEQLFLELEDKIREYRPRDDLAPVEKAFRLAAELHKGQFRQSGEPYMVHPLMVAHILAGMRMDLVTIETGLLHDLVEDTRMTPDDIREGFGDEVAHCVDGVTKLSKLDIFNAEERQAESFRKMLLAMVDDIRVIIVKLADRLQNMRTLGYLNAERRAHVATETIEIYAPIAHRLGMGKVRGELEDLAFRHPDRVFVRIWRYA